MIPLFKVKMSEDVLEPVNKVLMSGYIGQGAKVEEFEKLLRDHFGVPFINTLNSATSALHLAVRRLKTHNEADEILTTPLTCLHSESRVVVENGKAVPIRELVNGKYSGKVRSFNVTTGEWEFKTVTNWYKSKLGDRQWVRLTYKDAEYGRGGGEGVWLTDDHPVLLADNTYCAAGSVHGKSVIINEPSLNKTQLSFVVGTLLGDAWIQKGIKIKSRCRFGVGHRHDHADWTEVKSRCLNGFKTCVYDKPAYGNTQAAKCLQTEFGLTWQRLRREFYQDGVKVVPKRLVLDNLTTIFLAAWYMDDGHKLKNAALLCSESFVNDENEWLASVISKKFGFTVATINHRDGKKRIYIGNGNDQHNSAIKFFELIAPFVVPSYRYKLPDEIAERFPFNPSLWELGSAKPTSEAKAVTSSGKPSRKKTVYCLDVEDNHNFISGKIVLHNCTATNWPILANGVRLKWVDVDPETCNLDLTDLERKLTVNTIGVMVVHWGGYPVDLDRLKEIQNRFHKQYGFRFRIIEDCAHAWGSKYKGKLVGTHGHLSSFSFQAIKHFTTVDGGCLISPTEADHKKVKLLRWYGIDREQQSKDFRCLHGDTMVRFADGSNIKISQVVKKRLTGPVFMQSEGRLKPVNITGWHVNKLAGRSYIKMGLNSFGKSRKSVVTSDHLVHTVSGWKAAGELTDGEKVYTGYPAPSDLQRAIIVGSLMGDAGITTKRSTSGTGVLAENHSAIQSEYVHLKANALSGLGTKCINLPSDHARKRPNGAVMYYTPALPCFGEYRKLFYASGKKAVPRTIIEQCFSPLMMACWFMDDGRVQVNNSRNGLISYADIATNSFSEDEVEWLAGFLTKQGLSCSKGWGNGWRLFFDKNGSECLSKMIAKFVPPSMRYKVAHRTDIAYDQNSWGDGTSVVWVDEVFLESHVDNTKSVYCISVEGSESNFATTTAIVHNCEENIEDAGGKYHMNDVNATIGIHNYPQAQGVVDRHKANAAFYNEKLKGVPGVTLLRNDEGFESSYWIYTIKVKRRDDFMEKMKEAGVMVSRVHERNDKHTCVANFKTFLPALDALSKDMVCIPVGWWVTDEDREKIVAAIKKGW